MVLRASAGHSTHFDLAPLEKTKRAWALAKLVQGMSMRSLTRATPAARPIDLSGYCPLPPAKQNPTTLAAIADLTAIRGRVAQLRSDRNDPLAGG
jgi:hypothetical protein